MGFDGNEGRKMKRNTSEWEVIIFKHGEEYVANTKELQGVTGIGETRSEALDQLNIVLSGIQTLIDNGELDDIVES